MGKLSNKNDLKENLKTLSKVAFVYEPPKHLSYNSLRKREKINRLKHLRAEFYRNKW